MKKSSRAHLIPAFLFLLSGCSPNHLIANYYAVKAENAVDKASNMKTKKIPFEQRISIYEKACSDFLKAYQKSPDVFTLNRIETASDTCWKANKAEERDIFTEFENDYIKHHPQEFEHGDSGVGMMDVG